MRFSKSLSLTVLSAFVTTLSGCFNNPMLKMERPGTMSAYSPEFASVQVAPNEPLDPALLKQSATTFRLGPGDQVELEVIGEPSTRSTATVGPDGKIYFYLLPGIDVWGLTLPELRERIAAELKKFIREKPAVAATLRVAASERVWVLGRVNTPGIYTLNGPTTLLDAVAQAGGLSAASPYAAFAASLGVPIPPGGPSEAADLSRIEPLFDLTGKSGVPGALSRFFDSFSQLSVNPNNQAGRQQVIDALITHYQAEDLKRDNEAGAASA